MATISKEFGVRPTIKPKEIEPYRYDHFYAEVLQSFAERLASFLQEKLGLDTSPQISYEYSRSVTINLAPVIETYPCLRPKNPNQVYGRYTRFMQGEETKFLSLEAVLKHQNFWISIVPRRQNSIMSVDIFFQLPNGNGNLTLETRTSSIEVVSKYPYTLKEPMKSRVENEQNELIRINAEAAGSSLVSKIRKAD